jgi:NAD(P)-dependent dehydrogenase (short-subunit alcohol dehydrogenase family)
MAFPLNCAYVSSKFPLEGLSESMAFEMEQFGTKSILIEPGLIKTNFDNNLKIGKSVSSNPNSPYAEITQERLSGFKPRFEQGSSVMEVAKVILKAITSENPPKLRYLVGDDAFKLMEIEKIDLTQSLEN